jgi:polyisoprenoid-binding protein YceI
MKTFLTSLCLFLLGFTAFGQNLYSSTGGKITFFSKAPLENIQATATQLTSKINPANRMVAFVVFISSFDFENKLMQEHFNEKYMESDKFPKATFQGTINEKVDLTKPGSYPVTATGTLTIHGVAQTRTIPGTLTVTGNKATLTSDFQVKLVDHKITVPELVFKNIAEVIDVKITVDYTIGAK